MVFALWRKDSRRCAELSRLLSFQKPLDFQRALRHASESDPAPPTHTSYADTIRAQRFSLEKWDRETVRVRFRSGKAAYTASPSAARGRPAGAHRTLPRPLPTLFLPHGGLGGRPGRSGARRQVLVERRAAPSAQLSGGSPAARPLARSSARRPRPGVEWRSCRPSATALPLSPGPGPPAPPFVLTAPRTPRSAGAPGPAPPGMRSAAASTRVVSRLRPRPPRPRPPRAPPQAAPERPQHGGTLTAPHRGSPRPSPAPRRPARRASIRSMDAPLSLSLSPLRARHSLERSLDRAGSRGWQPAVRLATGGRSAAAAAAPLFAAALTAAGGAARARAGLPLNTRPRGGGSASCPRPAPLLPLSYRGQRSAAAEVQAADPETHRRPRPAGLRREANRRAGGGRGAGPGWSGLSGAGPVGAGRGEMMRRRSAAPRKAREWEESGWRGWGWAPAVRRAARGLRCAGRGGRPCGGLLCVPPRWRRLGPRGVWARGSLRGHGAAVSAQREAPARLGANVAPRADRC